MKNLYVLLIFIAGLLLLPSITFACGKHKHSCNKESSGSEKVDNCCGDNNPLSKGHDGCGGKCGHSRCGCAAPCSAGTTVTGAVEYKRNPVIILFGKPNFMLADLNLSAGFNSLWLIPKIS